MQAAAAEVQETVLRDRLRAALTLGQEAEVVAGPHQHQPRLIQVPAVAAVAVWLAMGLPNIMAVTAVQES